MIRRVCLSMAIQSQWGLAFFYTKLHNSTASTARQLIRMLREVATGCTCKCSGAAAKRATMKSISQRRLTRSARQMPRREIVSQSKRATYIRCYNPMSKSCMRNEREKHSVLRAKRFRRVRNVRCLRSIFYIVSFPTVCCSDGRCR